MQGAVQTTNSGAGAIAIGLEALSCVPGIKPKNKGNAPSLAMVKSAMQDFPEAKVEIMLASLYLVATNARSVADIQRAFPSYEKVVDQLAC